MNRPPKVLGFTGLAGCGKNTLADLLPTYYEQVSFAAPIKAMLRAVGVVTDPIIRADRETPLPEFGGKSARYLMQTLGTEWGRDLVDRNIWVNLAEKTCEDCLGVGLGCVLTDLRFPNEAEMVRGLGGKVVLIHRQECGNPLPHRSENQKIKPDYVVLNDGEPGRMLEQLTEYGLL